MHTLGVVLPVLVAPMHGSRGVPRGAVCHLKGSEGGFVVLATRVGVVRDERRG